MWRALLHKFSKFYIKARFEPTIQFSFTSANMKFQVYSVRYKSVSYHSATWANCSLVGGVRSLFTRCDRPLKRTAVSQWRSPSSKIHSILISKHVKILRSAWHEHELASKAPFVVTGAAKCLVWKTLGTKWDVQNISEALISFVTTWRSTQYVFDLLLLKEVFLVNSRLLKKVYQL